MRHCMVVHAQYPIGETRVEREAQALIDRGHHVDVICLQAPGEPRRSRVDGVAVHRLPLARRRGRGYAAQLFEYLAFFTLAGGFLSLRHLRRPYDVVQVHNLPDFLVFAALVPKLTGTPVLLDLHDLMPEFFAARTGSSPRSPLVRLVRWQERWAARFADHVITVTDEWRQTLIRRGVPAEKVSVVMNLADARIFQRDAAEDADRPERDGFHVLYHGTFTRRYGVDLLLDAVAQVRPDVPGIQVTLLGAGELGPALRAQRARLGLTDCVEISADMLPVTELPAALRAAHVGVVPNRSDVFTDGLLPTKLLELVAMGTPVIASRTPTIAAYFDQDMVQFFRPESATDLAQAIRVLAGNPERRVALAENAAAFNRKYSWETMAAGYAAVVEAAGAARDDPPMRAPDQRVPVARALPASSRGAQGGGYVCRASQTSEDRAWDAFLAATPGGHHTQTSMWARVKASMGWEAVRVVAEVDGRIVGGAQVLYRRVAPLTAVGYLHRGPVLAPDGDADVVGALVMEQVEGAAKALHIRHLTLQPYGRVEATPPFLLGRGYLETETEIAPRATVMIDVTREPDEILAAMQRTRRYNVRLSGRKAVIVREGGVGDLDRYYEMLVATAARQGFTPQPRHYFERMWRVLAPPGHLRLAVAEFEGSPLAAQIAIAFGDTVVNKLSVWSGRGGDRYPNEALQWSAIKWAHAHGFRYYDLEGVKLATARAALDGRPVAPGERQSVATFKLSFGGDIVLMPAAQVHLPNPALRWAFVELYPKVSGTRQVKALVKALRTKPGGTRREG